MKSAVKTTLAILVLALGTSCGPQSEEGSGASGGSGSEQAVVTVKGSDTMVHLATGWSEAFMDSHANVDVPVTGGGSGTGIAALLNGTTDVCNASRKIKQSEIDQAKEQGIEPVEFVVARDGIAVVVNPGNPVDALTIEQIGKIYTGIYNSWKDVGGPDEPIEVLSRESSSGTYVFFQEVVLDEKDYRADARLMPATSSILQAVIADKWSIGYVGLGYAEEAAGKVKVLGIKTSADAAPVTPTAETVDTGEYPIARPLHLYTAGQPEGTVKQYVDFCLGPEGQKIVQEAGYVPVKPVAGQ